MGVSGDKAENAFSGFIPLAVPRKGESPHIPATRLFVLFHPTKQPQKKILFQVVVEIAGDALVKVHALVAAHIVRFAGIHVEVGLRAGGDSCL